jgi:hypothetical protein
MPHAPAAGSRQHVPTHRVVLMGLHSVRGSQENFSPCLAKIIFCGPAIDFKNGARQEGG